MKRDIEIERILDHPAERVWRALTDAATLGAWFMENDLVLALGHRFTFRMKPQRGWDGLTYCEIVELEPLRSVAFTYRSRATGEKTLACAGAGPEMAQVGKGIFAELDTVLRFAIAEERAPGGAVRTRLTLQHRGFSGLKLVLVSFVMGMSWRRQVLPRLPPLLDDLARRERATASAPQ